MSQGLRAEQAVYRWGSGAWQVKKAVQVVSSGIQISDHITALAFSPHSITQNMFVCSLRSSNCMDSGFHPSQHPLMRQRNLSLCSEDSS